MINLMKLFYIPIILLMTGCSSFISVPLPLPVKPDLPKIQSSELECLSQDAYDKLLKRDILRENYEDKLRSIIQSTH